MMATRMLMTAPSTSVVISASVRSPDVQALAVAAGWSGVGTIALTINSGVDVATLSIPSTIPAGVLTLTNNGRIGGVVSGGTGLTVRTNITVINNGTIFGGGGDGGDGASAEVYAFSTTTSATGGTGGKGEGFSASGAVAMAARTSGGSGKTVEYSGAIAGGTRPYATSGGGGVGGPIGERGVDGNTGSWGGSNATGGRVYAFQSGKPAGNYIDGNAYVTWLPKGDVRGNAI